MRLKTLAICAIALLTAAVSGCVLGNGPQPSPTVTPPVTVTAVPPTPWPPATIGTITSGQVSVKDIRVSSNRNEDSVQSENISILFENSGRDWANNTFMTLRVTDSFTGEFYYASPQIDVGNIPPRSTRLVNVTTSGHDFGFSVLVQMEWFWGDNLEFHDTYKKSFTLAPVDWEHLYG
ncbi:MAG TPA: hypothetical protein VMC84_02415 [Methanocella sp.]|uniref:hypothetical protein n=1 Tax=Methanocella sp. TaxID=2052833 RepID=UPI002B967861|nr:hypothetical protein [Methanocella sp.]HTY90007.1 hypothetical protein [Methanocella sp.]